MDPADFASLTESIILPSIKMMKEWEDKKTVVGGLFAAQRAGAIIIETSTAEELSVTLQHLTFWGRTSGR